MKNTDWIWPTRKLIEEQLKNIDLNEEYNSVLTWEEDDIDTFLSKIDESDGC